jgi:opacity protein-like surface antigen
MNLLKPFAVIVTSILFNTMIVGQSNISYGINLYAKLSFLEITKSNTNPTKALDEKGYVAIGYGFGAQIQYSLEEQIFLRTGVNFNQANHQSRIENLIFPSQISGGVFNPNNTSFISNNIRIQSIGIPLEIGYYIPLKNKNVTLVIGLNGTLNLNTKTSSRAFVQHNDVENFELMDAENEITPSKLSFGLFSGVELNISNKLIIGIEPSINFTPNDFVLYPYDSEASTKAEAGLTLRLRMK